MNTFIRVAEVWVPSADGSLLELAEGLFDAAPAFGASSRALCFGRAEGLPGHAWDEGRPLLLRRFEGSYFRRTQAAQAAGLSCAVALPIFLGEELTSVVVLLCGDTEEHVGAIELWHNNPRIGTDLTLADGYFGSTGTDLEDLTRDSWLPRGSGAPGLAWQREAAVFIDNVGTAPRFLRAQVAASVGIVRALSIPCSVRVRETWVLSLLSSSKTPIARRVESWLPNEAGTHMQRAFGYCELRGRLTADDADALPAEALGPIGQAWRTGVARAVSGDPMHGGLRDGEAKDCGLRSVLAIPVIGDSAVSEVIALYF